MLRGYNEVNSSEMSLVKTCGGPARKLRAVPAVSAPVPVPHTREVAQRGREGCGLRGQRDSGMPGAAARVSGSTAGLSWQPSQPCAGLFAAEEQHTLILHGLAWTYRSVPSSSRESHRIPAGLSDSWSRPDQAWPHALLSGQGDGGGQGELDGQLKGL